MPRIADFLELSCVVDGTDLTGKKEFKRYQVIDALKDPQTWFCAANTFLSCIPNGGITTFGSLINKSFGFTNTEVSLATYWITTTELIGIRPFSGHSLRVAQKLRVGRSE